jgi:hypothetical protein
VPDLGHLQYQSSNSTTVILKDKGSKFSLLLKMHAIQMDKFDIYPLADLFIRVLPRAAPTMMRQLGPKMVAQQRRLNVVHRCGDVERAGVRGCVGEDGENRDAHGGGHVKHGVVVVPGWRRSRTGRARAPDMDISEMARGGTNAEKRMQGWW